MTLDDILKNFLSLTQDAVAIGYRPPGETSARLVYANNGFTDLFGHTLDDVKGKPVSVLHTAQDWPTFAAEIEPHIKAGSPRFLAEARCVRADGSTFWASLSLIMLDEDTEGGRFSIATYRDMNSLKDREEAANAALKDREKLLEEKDAAFRNMMAAQSRLHSAMDAYPGPFAIFDKDLTLVTSNMSYRKSLAPDPTMIRPGMHLRQIVEQAIDAGIYAEPPEGRNAFIFDGLDDEPVADFELAGDVHHRVLRSRTENGDYVILRLDITEIVRQRRAAEQAQNRLVAAINAYPDPFVIYDHDMRLVICNDAYASSMSPDPLDIRPGMHVAEVLGHAIDTGILPVGSDDRGKFIEETIQSARDGTQIAQMELSGDRHHRIFRNVTEQGDFVIVRLDISELVQQRRTAEELQERLLNAINAYPDPFSIFDRDLRLVSCNDAYRASVSRDPSKIQPGMHFSEVVRSSVRDGLVLTGDLDEDRFVEAFLKDLANSESTRDIALKGDVHHRSIRSASDNGDIVSIRIDITEIVRQQRAAQKAQQVAVEAQSRLISAISAYPDPFSIFDAQQNLIICNDAYRESMSTDPDSIRPGMHFSALLRNAIKCGVMETPEGGVDAHIEKVVAELRAGSRTMDAQLADDIHHRIILSKADNGDVVAMRIDVTELVRQRRAAEAAQTRLLSAVNAYPGPYCIYDADYRLQVFNQEYVQGFTDDPTEIRAGMTLEEVMWIGLRNGVFADAVGQEEPWLANMMGRVHATVAVDDLAIAGDVHHRLFRSRSETGDLIMVRVDMTEQVRQSRALKATQNRLISSINAFPDPFSIFDADGKLVIWNPAYALSMTGQPDGIREGMNLRDIAFLAARSGRVPAAEGREEEWAEEFLLGAADHPVEEEFEFENDTHFRIMRSRTEIGETMVLRLDITESVRQRRALEEYAKRLEHANEEITFKALHDDLTGLGNRRHLTDSFDRLCAKRLAEGGELSLLHIDLDRFKQINDTIGHAAGDFVLKEVAARIKIRAKSDDVIARIGGDEFIVLIYEAKPSRRPHRLAHALVSDMSKPVQFGDRVCRFGASVGLAQTPLADVDRLIAYSDIALYKAKRAGRAQVGVFDAQDVEDMRHTKAMADDILRGLEQAEFLPYYQPQIDARTGHIVGVEALARWNHPTKGLLLPKDFLSVAGDLNVESEIDRVIFDRAIAECGEAFAGLDPFPSLSFNVSAKRIHENVFDDIARAVNAYPGEVAFELLETIFLEEQDHGFLMQLDRLRDLGIAIEVDDFGSGRASVVALQRIAPDRLKIDGRLVQPITTGNNPVRLVQSMIEIGNALNIGVVAEGVETAEHARLLIELGVERLQGYYFARPLTVSGLRKFLDRGVERKFRN